MIRLNDYFCDEFLSIVAKEVMQKVLDEKAGKEHIQSCEHCSKGLKSLAQFFMRDFNPMNLLTFLRK